MKFLLDSSFILSLRHHNDSNHKEAVSILKSLDEESIFKVPSIVVAEILISSDDVNEIILYCKKLSENFELSTDSDLKFFKRIPYSKRQSLKANDCLILALCSRKKAKLLTFDKKLQKAYDSLDLK